MTLFSGERFSRRRLVMPDPPENTQQEQAAPRPTRDSHEHSQDHLCENRRSARARNLIEKVCAYLREHDTTDLDIRLMTPAASMRESLERVKRGENTISVTGDVLRDYLAMRPGPTLNAITDSI